MKYTTSKNTAWRDRYGQIWAYSLLAALAVHVAIFAFSRGRLADAFYELMIPSPTVLIRAVEPGSEMEVVSLNQPTRQEPQPIPPPEPEPEEEVAEVTPSEVTEEMTIAETGGPPSDAQGSADGVPGGRGRQPSAGGGGGAVSPPRPVHLVVPEIPNGVNKKQARGKAVHLLVQVLADGSVGEVKIEKGSRIPALDMAAMLAARQMRYTPAQRGGLGVTQWTRAEMRF